MMIENSNKIDGIYLAYKEKVQRYIHSKVTNIHDAEDLLSTVFLKVHQNFESFDENKASLSTWIYTITRNTLYDYFRTAKLTCEIPEFLSDDSGTEYDLLREETLTELADALAQLPQRERDLILLHYYKELSLKEIAQMMGVSYATVKNIHHKAVQQLRKLLKQYDI